MKRTHACVFTPPIDAILWSNAHDLHMLDQRFAAMHAEAARASRRHPRSIKQC